MLKGVIFDMDGTVTVPYVDWKALRAKIGAAPERTILDHIERLPPDRAAWADRELRKTEQEAAERAAPNEGLKELVAYLDSKGIRTALVTNSHGKAMRTVIRRFGLKFDVTLSRDDGELKPSGDLIEQALRALDVQPDEAIKIGDGRYDVEACRRTGVRCIYLTNGRPAFDHAPSAERLKDVLTLLRSEVERGHRMRDACAAP